MRDCFADLRTAKTGLTRGNGAFVWDTEGREYIDFGGGIAVLSLGHAAPAVLSALAEQAAQLMHTSNLFVNDAAVLLADKLRSATFARRVFLCNSGAEANEAALKLARRRGIKLHPEKYRVLSLKALSRPHRIGDGGDSSEQNTGRLWPLGAGFFAHAVK